MRRCSTRAQGGVHACLVACTISAMSWKGHFVGKNAALSYLSIVLLTAYSRGMNDLQRSDRSLLRDMEL